MMMMMSMMDEANMETLQKGVGFSGFRLGTLWLSDGMLFFVNAFQIFRTFRLSSQPCFSIARC